MAQDRDNRGRFESDDSSSQRKADRSNRRS